VASGFSRKAAAVAELPPVSGNSALQSQPIYLDPNKPLDERVDDLLRQMTLAEKMSLLGTTAPAIERLKIPVMNGWNQSLHGIVWTEPTTMFPVPISMAATWNPSLVHDVAAAIADEGRAVNNYWPTVKGTVEPTGGQGQSVTVTPTASGSATTGWCIARRSSTSAVIRAGGGSGKPSGRTRGWRRG
jgi:hypothetical protein